MSLKISAFFNGVSLYVYADV